MLSLTSFIVNLFKTAHVITYLYQHVCTIHTNIQIGKGSVTEIGGKQISPLIYILHLVGVFLHFWVDVFCIFRRQKTIAIFSSAPKKTTFENYVKTKQREDNQDNSHLF